MKRFLTIAVFTAAVAMLPNPAPADAQGLKACLQEAVSSCRSDFPGAGVYESALRGWCYVIRSALCLIP